MKKNKLILQNKNNGVPYIKLIFIFMLFFLFECYIYIDITGIMPIIPSLSPILNHNTPKYSLFVIALLFSLIVTPLTLFNIICLIIVYCSKRYREVAKTLLYLSITLLITSNAAKYLPITQHHLIDAILAKCDAVFNINSILIFNYMLKFHSKTLATCNIIYNIMPYMAVFAIFILAFYNNPIILKQLTLLYLISFMMLFPFYYFFPSYGPATLPHTGFLMNSTILHRNLYFLTKTQHIIKSVDVVGFPSYHILIMLYISFFISKIKFWGLGYFYILYTIILMPIVVILAEHFMVDIIGAFIFFSISIILLKLIEKCCINKPAPTTCCKY